MEARVTFFVVGLDHKTAPVELPEQCGFDNPETIW